MNTLGLRIRSGLSGLALASVLLAGPASAQGVQVANDLTTRTVRSEQSNLADVAVDALRASAKSDIAWMTASAFHDVSVPRGAAPPEAFLAALAGPDDDIVLVSLTGAQVRRALERSVAIAPQKCMAFLQVSGLAFTYDPAAPRDRRVVSVRVGKTALDPAKRYTVAMPAPLADGALAYDAVWSPGDIERRTNSTVAGALREYLTPQRTVGARPDERITARV